MRSLVGLGILTSLRSKYDPEGEVVGVVEVVESSNWINAPSMPWNTKSRSRKRSVSETIVKPLSNE